jgi:hypothetical protein
VGDGSGDEVRLLHRRSQVGYTSNPATAMPNEPEAISAADQQQLTELAHRRDRQRRLAAWQQTRATIDAALMSSSRPSATAPTTASSPACKPPDSAEQLGRRL